MNPAISRIEPDSSSPVVNSMTAKVIATPGMKTASGGMSSRRLASPRYQNRLTVKAVKATRKALMAGSKWPIASVNLPMRLNTPTSNPKPTAASKATGVGCRISAKPAL